MTAKAGETIEGIARRYGVNVASMERIERAKGGTDVLKEGETVVVYVPAPGAPATPVGAGPTRDELEPVPNGPSPAAPQASLLPKLP